MNANATKPRISVDNPARSQVILLELVRAAYRPDYVLAVGHALAVLFFLTEISVPLNRPLMLGWALYFAGVLFVYIGWYREFNGTSPKPESAAMWGRRHVIVNGALGIGWGFAGVVFFPVDNLAGQALLTTMVIAITAGSLAVSAAYLPGNYSMVIPMLSALIARTALVGGSQHIITAILLTVYLVYVLYGARTINRVLVASLRSRFENIDLIEELTTQTAKAERARREAEAANQAKSSLVNELTTQKARAENAKLAAESANRAKSRFLAAASHDLRQPLHALGLFAGALAEKIRYPEVRHIVNNISASVEALEALFNELLDISKLDAGVIEPNICHFSIRSTLDRLQTEYQARAAEKGLKFRVRPSDEMVHSDPMLLERILRNLVANAIQYTQAGGILVVCRRRQGRLRVEVRDSGMGINPEQREKIFEEFYQLANPERDRKKGLGLGLAIVRRLARLLGCEVDVKSVLGRGSLFSVQVPRGEEAAAPSSSPETSRKTPYHFDGELVVVVDDEVAVRESVQILLGIWGCEVVVAGSTEEALDLLADSRQPDLIVADYRLRGHATGIETIQTIQARFRANIPAVLITGDTDPDRLREAKASGFELLHKPVSPANLRVMLDRILKNGRRGSE